MQRLLLSIRPLPFLCMIAALFALSLILQNPALAQEAGQAAQAAGEAAKETNGNFLYWLIKVSGIIGLFIFLISVYFVAVVVQNILELRMSFGAPPDVVSACETMLNEGNVQGVVETVEADDSYFSQVLAAGLQELKYGLDDARDKLEATAEGLTTKMERKISILAVLGTLGPMIGLLGTLKGMIQAFAAIAMSGVNLEASKVAEAISEALVLTMEGVGLSIPAIFFYSFFRNRINMISHEATSLAEDQLKAAARLLKAKPAAAGRA